MAEEAIPCPPCHSERGVKYGRASNGKARYRWQTETCRHTFMRAYAYPGRTPYVKRQIVAMALNGSGVRDTARVLQVSPSTVIGEVKKSPRPLAR
jgi:insertion element IS1 protein InsB